MPKSKRRPLSEAEVDFLVQLANGNALALQRRKNCNKNSQKPPLEKQE